MDNIIRESEVAVDAEVGVGAKVEVGGVITWPTSSTPCAGHVTW